MLRLTPDLIAEIHAYTSGVLLARAEYALHPTTGRNMHSLRCAAMGCRVGQIARAGRPKRGAA